MVVSKAENKKEVEKHLVSRFIKGQIAKSNMWNLNRGRHQLCCWPTVPPFQFGWLHQRCWPHQPYTNVRIWNPLWETWQPKWSCVSRRHHFIFRELALRWSCQLLPVRSVFDVLWLGPMARWVCSTVWVEMLLSGYQLFCTKERSVKTNLQKVLGVAGRGQCNLLYDRTKINQTFPLDPTSLIGHRLHQQKCSRIEKK